MHARRHALVTAGIAIALLAGCGAGDRPEDVTKSYAEYKAAVEAKDGSTSAALVSDSTLTYYSGLRDLALGADKASMAKERIVDQLAVLSMRAKIPVGDLRGATPREVVAVSVEDGVISEGGGGITNLTKIEVSGDRATGMLGAGTGEASSTVPIGFRREDDTWKIDLTSLLAPAETALGQAVQQQKLEPQAMLEQVMTTRVGEGKARQLWAPLGAG